MALVNKLPSISSSSPQFRKPSSFNLNPVCSIHYTSSSSSPFTENHSIERYQRDNWLYKNQLDQPISCPVPPDPDSTRDYDIALQLPELKRLLEVLREKRESGGFGGERGRGPGNVFLVGTGPGDPELLTVKAVRVIQSAHLLLYDRLVSNEVLNLVGDDARFLYVGKTAGYHSRTQVLNKCQLGALVRAKEGKLDSTVIENGENWSVGQRQLICLGRALLKRSSILILDEATASVDSATDAVIQKVINQEFRDRTIVTIAHRIHTVIDSDLVLVLSEGRIAEFNTPAKLLEREDSFFSRLIKEYSMRSQGFNSLARLHN